MGIAKSQTTLVSIQLYNIIIIIIIILYYIIIIIVKTEVFM